MAFWAFLLLFCVVDSSICSGYPVMRQVFLVGNCDFCIFWPSLSRSSQPTISNNPPLLGHNMGLGAVSSLAGPLCF